jgi:hypothetical protein
VLVAGGAHAGREPLGAGVQLGQYNQGSTHKLSLECHAGLAALTLAENPLGQERFRHRGNTHVIPFESKEDTMLKADVKRHAVPGVVRQGAPRGESPRGAAQSRPRNSNWPTCMARHN